MKLIAVKVHVVTESGKIPTIIKLTAKFEDVVENCSAELTLNDLIHVNSEDIPTVSNEIDRITLEHPFFRLKLCESPIELKFFVYAMYKIPNLKPQVVIDQYRVDLAILEKRVAIELDGHEFHKSREDRTRDAKRERYLQRHGWQVIRFTGTEIHNDVFQCIDEAIQIVQQIPKKQ